MSEKTENNEVKVETVESIRTKFEEYKQRDKKRSRWSLAGSALGVTVLVIGLASWLFNAGFFAFLCFAAAGFIFFIDFLYELWSELGRAEENPKEKKSKKDDDLKELVASVKKLSDKVESVQSEIKIIKKDGTQEVSS